MPPPMPAMAITHFSRAADAADADTMIIISLMLIAFRHTPLMFH
jgi:hypothetical protein